ncbi:MAG TPA: cupredoxin domain-containing protein [Gaiellaceae bacterium]
MKILLLAALAVAGAAVAGVVAHASVSKTTIRVTEREFKIGLSTTHALAGPVRFEIKNTGKYPHALAISGAGVNTKTKLIQPGKSAVLLVTLKQGAYTLWCPVPGHAAQGMKAKVTTPGATVGAGTTTTTTTTTGETTTDDGSGYGY